MGQCCLVGMAKPGPDLGVSMGRQWENTPPVWKGGGQSASQTRKLTPRGPCRTRPTGHAEPVCPPGSGSQRRSLPCPLWPSHGCMELRSWAPGPQRTKRPLQLGVCISPLQDTRQGFQGLAGLSPAAPGAVAVAGTPRAVKAELSLGEGGRAGERQAQ